MSGTGGRDNPAAGGMRILLIDIDNDAPAGADSQLYARWSHHPLGLLSLAAAVRAVPGVEVRVLHTATTGDPAAAITAAVQAAAPQLVGLRALSIARDNFQRLARLLRTLAPGAQLLGGGPYPSASYAELLAGGVVDLVVIGEGEATFVELVRRRQRDGGLPGDLPGTAVRDGATVRRNPEREPVADLDALPFPAYDLLDLAAYAGISNHAFQDASRCAFICASRGCPYRCCYCHQMFGKRVRHRSAENIVAEMRAHAGRGISSFVFVDDCFNVPPAAAKTTLRLIARELPGVRLNFPNGLRADMLDGEMLDLLERAGTAHLALAVETASPRLQRLIGKNLDLAAARAAIDAASRRFIVCTFYMIGFPTETRAEAEQTIAFAASLEHVAQPVLSIVRVYPGTPLAALLEPDAEQQQRLAEQENAMLQPKLGAPMAFYGDYFPAERVPLRGLAIQELRWDWMRRVMMNPARIKSGHEVLGRHLPAEQVLRFYSNMFDIPGFADTNLRQLLGDGANT